MITEVYITPIKACEEGLAEVIKTRFNMTSEIAELVVKMHIKPHLAQLKNNCYLLIETPYVDKVFRDSYYHYFSTKLAAYNKDCIKVSIFDKEITDEDFRNKTRFNFLNNSFQGFFVLRPTLPKVFGRSVISPNALKKSGFNTCFSTFSTTVNGVKLDVSGFPHSSQDEETITCAETTIWAIMEYFSHRYPEYLPVLPSTIHQVLRKASTERQVPSRGLEVKQISFVLKEFGFGTIVYNRLDYGDEEFDKILSCYIESGIPLVIAVQNQLPNQSIAHALICVGHEHINADMVEDLESTNISNTHLQVLLKQKNIAIYDSDSIRKKFIFIDDNHPAYQKAYIDNPTGHYSTQPWRNCRVSTFIVPLHPRIYLEAFEAKNFVISFLLKGFVSLMDNSEIVLRFYLTSSRSYKDYLCFNDTFDENIKDIIVSIPMPKFVWIAELSDKKLITENKSNGLMILDATEVNVFDNKPLIVAAFQGYFVKYSQKDCVHQDLSLTLQPFTNFSNFNSI
jgi:hypothetical protein